MPDTKAHGQQIRTGTVPDDRLVEEYIQSDGSVEFTGAQSMGGFKLTNVGPPTVSGDAARLNDLATLKRSDKNLRPGGSAPSSGSDFFDTEIDIGDTPANDSGVSVFLNGVRQTLGDGTRTGVEFYFSNDAGATARALSAITAGDSLFFNAATAGFDIAEEDIIDLEYAVLVTDNN